MGENVYETEDTVAQYLHFHFGEGEGSRAANFLADGRGFIFPVETVNRLLDLDASSASMRALDLGCAVGRSAFELSRKVTSVVGSDLSYALIAAAKNIASGEPVSYRLAHDGGAATNHDVRLPGGVRPERIDFRVCDALKESGRYHFIHAANLLCRVPDPAAFLKRLPLMLEPGGQLALATPASWLEQFTPRDNWPAMPVLDFLKEHLEPHLELTREVDIPFVIREHERKFQLGISLGTSWRVRH